jgi:hypothetical protein
MHSQEAVERRTINQGLSSSGSLGEWMAATKDPTPKQFSVASY